MRPRSLTDADAPFKTCPWNGPEGSRSSQPKYCQPFALSLHLAPSSCHTPSSWGTSSLCRLQYKRSSGSRMAQNTDAQTQDLLTKNVKDLLWLNHYCTGKEPSISDALAALKSAGPNADGSANSNIVAVLESLSKADAPKQQEVLSYGLTKYVTELSLEHLMAAGLNGGEDTEEVIGWAAGAKYDFKKPELFSS